MLSEQQRLVWCVAGKSERSRSRLGRGIRAVAQNPDSPIKFFIDDKAVPGRKAQWIKDVQALFKLPAYNQFTALLQWGGLNIKANCPFDYSTSATATARFTSTTTEGVMRARVAYRAAI